MNNEPVAWIWSEDGCNMGVCLDQDKQIGKQEFQDYSIPLYTHPANPYQSITDTKIEPTVVSYTHPADLMDEEIIESLAELEHEQWMKWADTIMQTEKISDARFARWASCMIPYADLTEEMKEFDRVWARKALAILRKASEK